MYMNDHHHHPINVTTQTQTQNTLFSLGMLTYERQETLLGHMLISSYGLRISSPHA
jgi:hypothetical protein